MDQLQTQFVTLLAGVLMSGFSAYIGVRIGFAEMKKDIANHARDLDDHDERIKYLERRNHRQGND